MKMEGKWWGGSLLEKYYNNELLALIAPYDSKPYDMKRNHGPVVLNFHFDFVSHQTTIMRIYTCCSQSLGSFWRTYIRRTQFNSYIYDIVRNLSCRFLVELATDHFSPNSMWHGLSANCHVWSLDCSRRREFGKSSRDSVHHGTQYQ